MLIDDQIWKNNWKTWFEYKEINNIIKLKLKVSNKNKRHKNIIIYNNIVYTNKSKTSYLLRF